MSADYLLLIEDDADIIEALDLLFAAERIAWRRVEGAARVDRADPPRIALLDLSLGGVAGVVDDLRALGVPIVVTSAATDARDRAAALGAAACLEKPFDLSQLLDAIRTFAPGIGRK